MQNILLVDRNNRPHLLTSLRLTRVAGFFCGMGWRKRRGYSREGAETRRENAGTEP